MNDEIKLIEPPTEISTEVDRCIIKYHLHDYMRELNYHFNRGEWKVNLADTKRTMINYDFNDLVNNFYVKLPKDDNESNKDHKEREREETEALRSNLLKLYMDFRRHVTKKLTPIVKNMNYNDLFNLFEKTWGAAPFKLNYLLEDMFLLLGNKSIMQNVVGNSGSFKSTRTMIEANSLRSVLFIDDATVAGISRDCQTKGRNYLNNTVVYYNDVGDSAQMQLNFKDCLQSVYKKLFSEGVVRRTLAMKNSDRTLHLDLETPDGFKLKFNSVKPIFNEDDGQTASRTMLINLPSFSVKEAEEMILTGRFSKEVWTTIDPRIFKDVLQVYYQTRPKPNFTPEHRNIISQRVFQDNNGEVNWHLANNAVYKHEEMYKLYGGLYKEKYFNRVMINTSIIDLELELYEVIKDGLSIDPVEPGFVKSINNLNDFTIATTKSATVHKEKYDYDSFTITAVKGIRRKFIQNNTTKISELLRSMQEHNLCAKIGKFEQYNVYVLLKQ